jgi:hypothetical protein
MLDSNKTRILSIHVLPFTDEIAFHLTNQTTKQSKTTNSNKTTMKTTVTITALLAMLAATATAGTARLRSSTNSNRAEVKKDSSTSKANLSKPLVEYGNQAWNCHPDKSNKFQDYGCYYAGHNWKEFLLGLL